MKFSRYEYHFKDHNNEIIIDSFTLKENAKHKKVVEKLKATKVEEFEVDNY